MSATSPKVPAIFMGSDPMVLPVLEALSASQRLDWKGIFTQPDRPHGRGQKLEPNVVKCWAQGQGLPVIQPEKVDDTHVAWLKEQGVQVAFVMAFGQLLRLPFLEALPLGAWNFHVSILPKYRGTSPIQSAIAQGDRESGVSLMRIVLKMDAGPVLSIGRVVITPEDNHETLSKRIAQAAATIGPHSLEAILSNTPHLVPQDESQASYVRKLVKEDAALDFNEPADKLACRIRAQWPWPGAWIEHAGQKLKIGMPVNAGKGDPAQIAAPGTVLGTHEGTLKIACAQGVLKIQALQRPTAKMLPISEFLRGYPIETGTVFPSHPMQPLVFKENPYLAKSSIVMHSK
ncbi:MAG TPA: methionyl-tRNA formyltransferase [Opitutales bacterium]|nr:methionyl-tRNA formyltransferase [Opitutales bacterium]